MHDGGSCKIQVRSVGVPCWRCVIHCASSNAAFGRLFCDCSYVFTKKSHRKNQFLRLTDRSAISSQCGKLSRASGVNFWGNILVSAVAIALSHHSDSSRPTAALNALCRAHQCNRREWTRRQALTVGWLSPKCCGADLSAPMNSVQSPALVGVRSDTCSKGARVYLYKATFSALL